jgi:hypothetical protein
MPARHPSSPVIVPTRRRHTHRLAPVALLAVLSAGAAGCSDDAGRAGESPAPFSSSTGSETPGASATSSPSPSSGPTLVLPTTSSSTVPDPFPSGGSPTSAASTGPDPALTGGPATLPARRPYEPPAAGRYTYENTGSSSVSGCATATEPADPMTDVDVSAVRGARQEAVRRSDEEGTETSVVEYRSDGIHLVSLVFDQPGLGRIEFRPARPVLLLPGPARDGQTWRFTLRSTDGKYTVDADNRVEAVGSRARTVDGRTVPTTRVRSVVRLRGTSPVGPVDVTITAVSEAGGDPALGILDDRDTDGTVGPCRITGEERSRLRSTTPTRP